jgi:signal transduction histidine kinase
MIYTKNLIKSFLFFIILISIIILATYFYLIKKEKILLESRYINYTNTMEIFIKNLIEDKKNATLIMAISLSKDEKLTNFLKNKDELLLNYKNISDELKENTKFKNVWIQIIDIYGNSIYRSWTDKKTENLSFRKDIKETLINQKPSSSISVGAFDLTIKGRAPVYEKTKIIGFIEVITHFDSILKKLEENNINSVVIADKKYKKKIIYPFSNTFIGDYYISNSNKSVKQLSYINMYNIQNFIDIDNYIIKNNYLINKYKLSNKFDSDLAYIINFTKLDDIDIETIKSFRTQLIMTILITLIILISIFIFYVHTTKSKNIKNTNLKLKKHIKQLRIQQNYKQSILDSQSNIIVITDGKNIIGSNKKLLDFFTDVKDLREFKEKYICICSAFIEMEDDKYIIDKDYNNKNWAEYILENPNDNFKVAMYNNNKELKHFSIKTSLIEINQNLIVTLTDITTEIKQIEINKEKDRILFQQSKITAVADTLKNIAHQWRQPLSVISTIASGMKIQKEMNLLDDLSFDNSCDNIINNTNKLSTTIEKFSNFFYEENQISNFLLFVEIEKIIDFLNPIFEENQIKIISSYDKDLYLNCNKTEFSQAIISILDNSVYALNNTQEEKYIFIDFKNNILQINDTGTGIDEEIISKILEPYFTTKHQAFGVGLGLYIVQEFFVKKLNHKIDIKNIVFEYKNKKYSGTSFIIDFN